MDLKKKVVIVTGASSGVGREICALLAKEKARVVCVSRSFPKVVEKIKNYGGEAVFVKADVAKEKQMENVFLTAKRKFGKIDAVINNAGILISKPIDKTSLDEFDKVFEVNVRGEFIGCKLAKKYMKKGVIVNASSDVGLYGKPNLSVYSSSKFAIIGITESLAREFKNIKVFAVTPRSIATGMSNFKGNSPVLVARKYVWILKNATKLKSGKHFVVGKEKDATRPWKNGVPSVKL